MTTRLALFVDGVEIDDVELGDAADDLGRLALYAAATRMAAHLAVETERRARKEAGR